MKNIFKTLLLAVILAFAFTVNTTGQTVYSFTSTSISSTGTATVYLTYPSPFKTNYVLYTTINADTTVAGDSTILIHQAQISMFGTDPWFDYGDPDTLINIADVAEKDEDYLYTDTPWKYFRHKFTQQDTATTTLSGYMLLKTK